MAIVKGTLSDDYLIDDSFDPVSTLNANWSAGDDVMLGGRGNDIYNVNSVADRVVEFANEGTDTVVSRTFSYTLGANVEHLKLDNTPTQIRVNADGTIVLVPSAVNGSGNAASNLIQGNDRDNTLSGGGGNDRLYGHAGIDTLKGDVGDDYLNGGSGNDTLYGGLGTDTLNGGTGADTMAGGSGNDTYHVDTFADVVVESAFFGGVDTVLASVNETLDANVENLSLTGTAAKGTGNGLGNRITGNASDNSLYGRSGNDTLGGGAGADWLFGGTGDDTLRGDIGNDELRGDQGEDVLTGGLGNDKFVFSHTGHANADRITDFSHSSDSILLMNSLDAGTLGGALTFGIRGLSFVDGNRPGHALSNTSFFKGMGSGDFIFQPSGIYVDTSNGQIWYNPTTAIGGDTLLVGRVSAAVASTLDASDFVYGG